MSKYFGKVPGRNDEASVIRLYVKSQVINCYGEAERPHRNKIFFPFYEYMRNSISEMQATISYLHSVT